MDTVSFDNVTYRKRQTAGSLDSTIDLSITTYENEGTLLDTTMMSLPDSLHNSSSGDTINNLNEQIKMLQMQLMSAHQEIENLNCENIRLKSDLQLSLKSAERYKNICLTPDRKINTPSSIRKKQFREQKTPVTQYKNYNKAKKSSQMLDKETQTIHGTTDSQAQSQYDVQSSSQKCRIANKNVTGTKLTSKPKNKLCVISSGCTKGTLHLIREIFSDHFDYCHYLLPNTATKDWISNIEHKLQNFTLSDYCLIFISENDIKNKEYINLLDNLNNSLKSATHTNNIICTPTYIKGALIHNYKVELFNNLLCLDVKNREYAYVFDSNAYLAHEMFSYKTGIINKNGWRKIYEKIMSNILIDYKLFSAQEQQVIVPMHQTTEIDECTPQDAGTETFFRDLQIPSCSTSEHCRTTEQI